MTILPHFPRRSTGVRLLASTALVAGGVALGMLTTPIQSPAQVGVSDTACLHASVQLFAHQAVALTHIEQHLQAIRLQLGIPVPDTAAQMPLRSVPPPVGPAIPGETMEGPRP